MLPKCIIFDFGNVIAFFDHRKSCKRFARLSKDQLTEDDIYNELFQPDGLERRYDRGEISTEKFFNEIKRKFKISTSLNEIESAWCDIFFPNKLVIELLHRLKEKKYQLLLASNTNELHYKWFSKQFADALRLFDGEIVSFNIGFRKPEKEFFDHCIKKSNSQASECVFIDDQLEFVTVAKQVGMKGIWYTSIDQFPFFLEEVGVRDDDLLTYFEKPTIRSISNFAEWENEFSLTLYREKYANFRHFDTLRWQIPGLVFLVAGAIIGFAPRMSNGYPAPWILIFYGIFVVLFAWLMSRISQNMKLNTFALKSLAIRLGDYSIPKSPGKRSAAFWIEMFFWLLGVLSVGAGILLSIN